MFGKTIWKQVSLITAIERAIGFALSKEQKRPVLKKVALAHVKALIRNSSYFQYGLMIIPWIDDEALGQIPVWVFRQLKDLIRNNQAFRSEFGKLIINLIKDHVIDVALKNFMGNNNNKMYIFLRGFIVVLVICIVISIFITFQRRHVHTKLVENKELSSSNFLDFFNLNPSPKRKGDLDCFLGFDATSYHEVI